MASIRSIVRQELDRAVWIYFPDRADMDAEESEEDASENESEL